MNCKKQLRSALSLLCAAAMLCGCTPQEESSVKEADTESPVSEITPTEATTTTTEATTTEATTTVTTTTAAPEDAAWGNATFVKGLHFGMTKEEAFAVLGTDYYAEGPSYTWLTGEQLDCYYYTYELSNIPSLRVEMEATLELSFSEHGYLYEVAYYIGEIPNETAEYGSDHPYNADELTAVYNALLERLTDRYGEGIQQNDYGYYIDEYEWFDTVNGDIWYMVNTDTWGTEGLNLIFLICDDVDWLEVTARPGDEVVTTTTTTTTTSTESDWGKGTIAKSLYYGMTEEEVFAVLGTDYYEESSASTWLTGEQLNCYYYVYELSNIPSLRVELSASLFVYFSEQGYLYEVAYCIGQLPDSTTSYSYSYPYSEDELTAAYDTLLVRLNDQYGDGTQQNIYGDYIDEYEWSDTSAGDLWYMVDTDSWDIEGMNLIYLTSSDPAWLE